MGVAGPREQAAARISTGRRPHLRVAGYYAKDIVFGQAGIRPEDVDVTGSYDAFTFTTMLQLEEYGFCKKGEGGAYVSSGIIELGGTRPNNTSGSHLCEGYTHGMSMVIENVRQLRGTVDDYCPGCGRGQAQLRLLAEAVPAGEGRRDHDEPRLGHARHGLGPHPPQLAGASSMPSVEYRGMNLVIPDNDSEWREHFKLARAATS